MTDQSKRWFSQELRMVKDRVLLKYIPIITFGRYTTFYTGNPMGIRQGLRHLMSVVDHIKENPELYKE